MIEIHLAVVIKEDIGIDLVRVAGDLFRLLLSERPQRTLGGGNGNVFIRRVGHIVNILIKKDLRSPELAGAETVALDQGISLFGADGTFPGFEVLGSIDPESFVGIACAVEIVRPLVIKDRGIRQVDVVGLSRLSRCGGFGLGRVFRLNRCQTADSRRQETNSGDGKDTLLHHGEYLSTENGSNATEKR